MRQALRVCFQINLDFPMRGYIAGLFVVFKIRTVNLVEACRITAIKSNRDIMERRLSPLLVLNGVARLYFEKSTSTFRFRDGESLSALLDFNVQFSRNFF